MGFSIFPKSSESSNSTGSFTVVLPEPLSPANFVADRVVLNEYKSGNPLYFFGHNTTEYGRDYTFACALPASMEVGVDGLYPVGPGFAWAGLTVGSGVAQPDVYFGVSGAIEYNYSVVEKRINGKFFFSTEETGVFQGNFDIYY